MSTLRGPVTGIEQVVYRDVYNVPYSSRAPSPTALLLLIERVGEALERCNELARRCARLYSKPAEAELVVAQPAGKVGMEVG
jgi:hypothetical protein